MYKRKIEQTLSQWKAKKGHKPLVIKGCRQCGKTSSVVDFASKNYPNVICLNSAFGVKIITVKFIFIAAACKDNITLVAVRGN